MPRTNTKLRNASIRARRNKMIAELGLSRGTALSDKDLLQTIRKIDRERVLHDLGLPLDTPWNDDYRCQLLSEHIGRYMSLRLQEPSFAERIRAGTPDLRPPYSHETPGLAFAAKRGYPFWGDDCYVSVVTKGGNYVRGSRFYRTGEDVLSGATNNLIVVRTRKGTLRLLRPDDQVLPPFSLPAQEDDEHRTD